MITTEPTVAESSAMIAGLPEVSVVISKRNRGGGILTTLQALIAQDIAPCEVIVTDQSDTGQAEATRQAILQAASDSGWQAYCINEDGLDDCGKGSRRLVYLASRRRGLSAGRNSGARCAHGDVLLFTDDDVIPDRHWVAAVAGEFAVDPKIASVGGRILPYNREGVGAEPARQTGTEVVRSGTERREYDAPVLPWHLASGGNLAVRRSIFETCGGFDEVLGAGGPLKSCEDLDICYRLPGNIERYCGDGRRWGLHTICCSGRRSARQARSSGPNSTSTKRSWFCPQMRYSIWISPVPWPFTGHTAALQLQSLRHPAVARRFRPGSAVPAASVRSTNGQPQPPLVYRGISLPAHISSSRRC